MAQAIFDKYALGFKTARHAVSFMPGWGTHRLTLHLECTATGVFTPKAPHAVAGSLWATDLPGLSGWLGHLTLPWPIGTTEHTTNVGLDVALTDVQLHGLEKARSGKDLTLRADLTVTDLSGGGHWPARQVQESITVPHGEWAKALASLNQGAFVDVLVPITDLEDRATAARRIREAQEAIRNGDFETAVTRSRAALDAVRDACNTDKVHSAAIKKIAKDRDQAERWAMLIQAAYALFSGAPHDDAGTTEHFTWTRADAVAAVATAAGLLARLEDLP
ncbi:hypothetical protein [Kitasatospora aureofaciens]|uniref:hypothetical protein n=1 Tax=Kitasatospora aureofaciens TaxID=1894 RepID=UPI0037C72806